jgi:hypothetical protein
VKADHGIGGVAHPGGRKGETVPGSETGAPFLDGDESH